MTCYSIYTCVEPEVKGMQHFGDLFFKAFHSSPAALVIARVSDGICVDVNGSFLNLLEYRHEEVVNHSALDLALFPNDTQRKEFNALTIKNGSLRNYETVMRTKTGKLLSVLLSKELIQFDGQQHTLGTVIDITECKQAEKALMENQERLEVAQRIAHVGSWEYFVKTDEAIWSEELFHIFGLKPDKRGPNLAEYSKLIYPEDLEDLRARMEKLIATGKVGETISFDFRVICSDGSIRYLHTERMVREVDENGGASRIAGIEQDITERKKSQEELQQAQIKLKEYTSNLEHLVEERTKKIMEEEQSYRELYESFGEAFIATDWDFNVIHWNKTAERITKVNAQDALGKKVYDVLPEMLQVDINPHLAALQERKPARFMMNTISRETGRKAIFEVSTYPSTKGIIIIVEDKTEEDNNRRLSIIGQTAGMVGHDIRNPLQAIMSDVYLLKDELKTMPECLTKKDVTESLDSVETNINYINKIVADLQDYARQIVPEYSHVILSDVFTRVFQNIRVPDSIKLSLSITAIDRLRTDSTLIQRALTNLVNNAVQAMPQGGNLEVRGFRRDNIVVITVRDTGVGIPDEIKPNLFTPMMTTKAKGQGFGLAVTKRIVEALSGTVSFESQEGIGTKFIIELPQKES
jgi:PAS domain S-box-containing protein